MKRLMGTKKSFYINGTMLCIQLGSYLFEIRLTLRMNHLFHFKYDSLLSDLLVTDLKYATIAVNTNFPTRGILLL